MACSAGGEGKASPVPRPHAPFLLKIVRHASTLSPGSVSVSVRVETSPPPVPVGGERLQSERHRSSTFLGYYRVSLRAGRCPEKYDSGRKDYSQSSQGGVSGRTVTFPAGRPAVCDAETLGHTFAFTE